MSGDPLHDMGIAVPFQPSDGRGLAVSSTELVDCVTVEDPDTGEEIVVPTPVVVDVEIVETLELDPNSDDQTELKLDRVAVDEETSLETKELNVEEMLSVMLRVLDDCILDV